MAQTIAKQKLTKNINFQDENTKEETVYAPRGSHGGLQSRFHRAARNLHFMKPTTMVITMGFPFVVAFEVEVVEQDSKYEKRLLHRFSNR